VFGAALIAHRLDAMADVPSGVGRITRERFDSCPRSSGKVPTDVGIVDAPTLALQLREGYPLWQLAPPTA
jgi:hypothetical protein